MKAMRRVLALLLALTTLAVTAISCGGSDNQGEESTTTSATDSSTVTEQTTAESTTVATTEDPAAAPQLEGLDYKGEPIHVISRNSDWVRDEIWAESINGDVVNDAIYERNAAVEDRIGVSIDNIYETGSGNYAISDTIRTAVKSGTDEFDVVANSSYSTIMYSSENIFHNLYNCDYLDLESPYWAQGFNEAASIGEAQYMCTGAAALTLFRYMFVTFFNKEMIAEVSDVNLYEVVNQGKWTLDYQYELTSKMYADLDGNGQKDENDSYGFVCTNMAYIDPYWSSCELPILTKDENNAYVYAPNTERMSAALDKILRLWYENEGSYIFASVSDAENQNIGTSAIAERRAATTTLRLVSVESADFRNMTDTYGIIPVPKMEESQDGYQTFLHDQFTAFGIVSTVKENRLQMVGAFLEALAAESYETVVPAYYELALKTKYVSDEESGMMLDMIYQSIYIDAGVLYTKSLESVHQQLRNAVKSERNNIASMFKAQEKVVAKRLENLNKGLLAIQ